MDRLQLQLLLLLALATFAVLATISGRRRLAPQRRQLWAVILPVVLLLAMLIIITTVWTTGPAFLHPVGFLMGHATAEDNAKWLDFTSQFASGGGINQAVPLGGPLELYMVFIGTAMGAISEIFLHGYNQVAVAANTEVYGELFLAVIAPLALTPLVEARFRSADGTIGRRIPIPFLWLGMLTLSAAVLLVTEFGHLTFQFTMIVVSLWAAVFLSQVPLKRARLISSLIVAGNMTVWLPLNVLAVVILVGWLFIMVYRGITKSAPWDLLGLGLWLVFALALWQPIRSSLTYFLTPSAMGLHGSAAGVSALAGITQRVVTGFDDSGLFSANGGTEQTQPLLALLAAGAVVACAFVLSKQSLVRRTSLYRRMAPIGLIALCGFSIYAMDFWSTGGGPHYGSMKFTFMVSIVCVATCLPIGLMIIDPGAAGRMSPVRWIAIFAVIFLMVIDSFLPRALNSARPQQWSPSIPFNNPQSWWYPAEVNGLAHQSIAGNPMGCIYLPQGAQVPTAILASQLSPAEQVYDCTRILTGLSGLDGPGEPVVDWLRREWLTNKSSWADVWDYLNALPENVKEKQLITLDDGSNVIGLDTINYLLQRYPKTAGQGPATSTSSGTGTAMAGTSNSAG